MVLVVVAGSAVDATFARFYEKCKHTNILKTHDVWYGVLLRNVSLLKSIVDSDVPGQASPYGPQLGFRHDRACQMIQPSYIICAIDAV